MKWTTVAGMSAAGLAATGMLAVFSRNSKSQDRRWPDPDFILIHVPAREPLRLDRKSRRYQGLVRAGRKIVTAESGIVLRCPGYISSQIAENVTKTRAGPVAEFWFESPVPVMTNRKSPPYDSFESVKSILFSDRFPPPPLARDPYKGKYFFVQRSKGGGFMYVPCVSTMNRWHLHRLVEQAVKETRT